MDKKLEARRIDLDTYTEGDAEFKKELAGLLIVNIIELRIALSQAIEMRTAEKYVSACHKLRTSIGILNADDFAENIDAIREALLAGAYPSPLFDKLLADFTRMSEGFIDGLRRELQTM